ncbi:MAG: translocation/assembly module TamB [candidate division WOR-3 bacterium]|nr:translocation/assembly module TamB [candidate division WOR-3 bacterium]MCX7837367.1 translocation/assembly module TamB [candidate division WOR-3 bacterium]
MSFKKGYFIFILILLFFSIGYFILFFTTKNYLLPKLLKGIGVKEIKEVKLSFLFNQIVLSKGRSDFFDFEKIEIKFNPLLIFKRKISIEKFILEKLAIKVKEEEAEKEKRKRVTFILPIFLREIEIEEAIFQDLNFRKEKLGLRNLKINLKGILKKEEIKVEVDKISGEIYYDKHNYNFSLFKTELEFSNGKFLLTNLNLKIKNSFFYGELIYNLKENGWEIKIDSSFLNLKDFTDYEGEGKIKGNLIVKDNKYNGKIDIFFKKAKIVKEIENLEAELNFAENLVFYQLTGKILGSSFKSKGKFDLKDFSYNLIAEIFNLENLLPLKIEKGKLVISGKKLVLINFKFDLTFLDKRVSFLKGEGDYQNKKIFIKNLIGKGTEIDFFLKGEADKEKIVILTEISKLPLEIFNNFLKNKFKGIIKGKGEVIYGKKYFSLKGDWQIKDFYFEERGLSFKDFNFLGNFSLKERIALKGKIDFKELKTPLISFDSLILSSFDDFQLLAVFNNSLFKARGSILSDLKDSFLFSLKELEFIFNGNNFLNQTPITIGIKKNSFKLENFNLKYCEGELIFDLEKKGDILKLKSEIENLALENLFLIKKRKEKLFGKLKGQVFLTYDLKNKYLNNFLLNTKIFDFQFQNIVFDSLIGNFSLKGETILVRNFSLFKEGKNSEVYGFLIFDFGKRELVSQNLTIELKDFPSEIIFFIPNILTVREGKFNGRLILVGNLRNPLMRGRADLSGGEIILKIPETKIKDVSATIIFSEKEVIFYQILGKVKDGEVLANGFIKFGEYFKIDTLYKDIKFNNLPITYQRDFLGIVKGNLSLSFNKRKYLNIISEAEIKEALITIPFGIKKGDEKKMPDTLLELDLTFKGEKNIWLRNKNADAELAVDFNIKLKKGEFIYTGRINTKQGYLYYLGRSLQLEKGEIVFENISQFNPRLSLIGFLLTKPIAFQNRRERFKIFLEVSGYLSSPNFNLYSEPPYLSQEEMISYLGLSFTPEELKNWEEKDIFLDILQDRILSYFERETSQRLRKYIGLDYFRLETSFRGEPYLRLSVGKYLGEKLYFSYTHSFIEEKQDVFRAEYYLNENHQIIGERNELGKTVIKYLFYFRF